MVAPFQIHVNEERKIRGDVYFSRNEPLGTLILCHGFKGFKDWGFFPHTAQQLAKHVHVITFNFSWNGMGDSKNEYTELEQFAKNTYSRELEDLQIVIDQIRNHSLPIKQDIADTPLFLLGHSRGAGISLIYAFDYPKHISGVISWNGITNVDLFDNTTKDHMRKQGRAYIQNARTKQNMPLDIEILEDMEKNQERFNIIERSRATHVPIVLIQGTEDHPKLVEGSAKLIKNNPKIRWVQIPGGNHTFGAVHPFEQETDPLNEAIVCTQQYLERWLKIG